MIRACYALAALRLLFLLAAWPFFDNVDEQHHVDMIVKVARGHLPRGLERYDAESTRLIARAETWEVFGTPGPDRPPPAWRAVAGGRYEATRRAWWEAAPNIESTGPPVPYLLGAAWRRVGGLLGLDDVGSLYWLRLLNVPVYLGAMAAAVRFATLAYPGDPALPASVAVLLAVFPQDLYYGVNADVPAILFGTLALLGLWRMHRRGCRSPGEALASGLLLAAALLTKASNVAVLAPLAFVASSRLRAGGRKEAARIVMLVGAAALPVAGGRFRNAGGGGDVMGTAAKVAALGWTAKPVGACRLASRSDRLK
ncbi:MAG: DUF2142 domain-containing protein, partial [bacterium]